MDLVARQAAPAVFGARRATVARNVGTDVAPTRPLRGGRGPREEYRRQKGAGSHFEFSRVLLEALNSSNPPQAWKRAYRRAATCSGWGRSKAKQACPGGSCKQSKRLPPGYTACPDFDKASGCKTLETKPVRLESKASSIAVLRAFGEGHIPFLRHSFASRYIQSAPWAAREPPTQLCCGARLCEPCARTRRQRCAAAPIKDAPRRQRPVGQPAERLDTASTETRLAAHEAVASKVGAVDEKRAAPLRFPHRITGDSADLRAPASRAE